MRRVKSDYMAVAVGRRVLFRKMCPVAWMDFFLYLRSEGMTWAAIKIWKYKGADGEKRKCVRDVHLCQPGVWKCSRQREHVNVKVNICCGFHVRMGAPGVLSDRSSHPFIRQGPAIVSAPSAEDDESEDFSLEGRERKVGKSSTNCAGGSFHPRRKRSIDRFYFQGGPTYFRRDLFLLLFVISISSIQATYRSCDVKGSSPLRHKTRCPSLIGNSTENEACELSLSLLGTYLFLNRQNSWESRGKSFWWKMERRQKTFLVDWMAGICWTALQQCLTK